MKTTEEFESFVRDFKAVLGRELVDTVGPTQDQFAFATTERDEGPDKPAKWLDKMIEAKAKYPSLRRCGVMPFGISEHVVYVIAGLGRAGVEC